MKMLVRIGFALALSLGLASAASSQEILRNDASQADPKPAATAPLSDEAQAQAEADGAWAQAVMDKAKDGKQASAKSGCVRNPDRDPHGEAWVSAGSHGYSDYGVIATKPVGNCSTLTVGFSQGGYGRGYRGR